MVAAVAASAARFFVGNITTNGQVRSDFCQHWNQITPENEGKWGQVEPTRDVYNWSGLDRGYNYAMQNNIPFKQHTFIWGAQPPTLDQLAERIRAGRGDRGVDPRLLCALSEDGDDRRGQRGHADSPAGRVCAKCVREQLDHPVLPAGAAVLPQRRPDPQRLQRAELGHRRVHPVGDSGRRLPAWSMLWASRLTDSRAGLWPTSRPG